MREKDVMVRSRWSGVLGATVVLLGSATLAATGSAPAGAATAPLPPSAFGDWQKDLDGTPGAYVSHPTLGPVSKPVAGFPAATVVSDSARTASVPTGLSTWWGPQTPPGKYYGSSRNHGFLNIRPASDTPGTPSSTTITFAGEKPDGAPTAPDVAAARGWGFVVGDVDSETVTLSATLADGQPADADDLGFAGAFNACATRDRMASCPTPAGAAPTWDPDTRTLTGLATDSIGADAWFVPTARLASLTLTSSATSGSPVFQTWLVSRTHVLSGTVGVSSGTCDVTQAKVRLVDQDDHQIGLPVPVGTDGTWTFGQTVAGNDLSVRLHASGVPGCAASSLDLRPALLATGDARIGFTVAQSAGQDVLGSVVDDENDPVEGAKVTLRVGSIVRSVTTGASGEFTLRSMPPNVPDSAAAYAVTLTPPGGLVMVGTRPAAIRLQTGQAPDRLDFVVEGTRLSTPSSDPAAPKPPSTAGGTGAGAGGVSGGTGGVGGVTGPAGPSGVTATGTPVTPVGATSGGTYSAAGAYTSASTSPTTSALPDTGGPQLALLTGGTGLLLAGAGTVLVGRRRRA